MTMGSHASRSCIRKKINTAGAVYNGPPFLMPPFKIKPLSVVSTLDRITGNLIAEN
jgi:hypothetical protein